MFLFPKPLRVLLRASFRLAYWLALGGYFAATLAYLGVRYWALPQLDTWRPAIVQQLSLHLGLQDGQLNVGRMALDWHRADPVFVLDAVQMYDERGGRVLHLPEIRGRLSWRGLLRGQLWFQELELNRLELALHRDVDGRVRVLGQTVDVRQMWASAGEQTPQDALRLDPPALYPALYWLGQQKRVVLRDAALTWTDATRGNQASEKNPLPALTLNPVTLVWLHERGRYQLALTGQPDPHIGGQFRLDGEFVLNAARAGGAGDSLPADLADPKNWDARVYVSMRDMQPEGWRNWLALPHALSAQRLSAQWWLTVQQGELAHVALHAALSQGRWQGEKLRNGAAGSATGSAVVPVDVSASAAQVWVQGSGQAYRAAVEYGLAHWPGSPSVTRPITSPSTPSLAIQLSLQDLRLTLPALFGQPLQFDDLNARAHLGRSHQGQPELTLAQVQARNADMDVNFSGRWQPHARSRTGWAALQGVFTRADMAALVSYFPLTVSAAAKDWMRTGLLGGQIRQAPFLLEGELDRFPFGRVDRDPERGTGAAEHHTAEQTGQWRLDGRYENGLIDYAPAHADMQGWPRLERMHGQLAMRNTDLRLTAERAQMVPADGHTLTLTDVQAHIPDLMHGATLHLRGDSEASAAAYLALVRNSPVTRWLDGLFDQAHADGRWRVPLRLSVPLLHSAGTRARGQVQFQEGRFKLFDHVPVFENVSGALDFSEWSISTQALRAQFLGGAVQVSGGLGTGQNGLGLTGRATLPGIKDAFNLHQPLHPLDGAFSYGFLIEHLGGKTRQDGTQADGSAPAPYRFSVRSDLAGVTSTLPAPLAKAATTRWPMHVTWSPLSHGASALDVQIADGLAPLLTAQFVRPAPVAREAHALGGFARGAVRVGHAAELPALPASAGLRLNIQHKDTLDLSAWLASLQAMGLQPPKAGREPSHTRQPYPPPAPRLPVPFLLNLHADHLYAGGLRLDAAFVNARYEPARSLRLDVDAAQAAGTVLWAADTHTVQAHFSRLALDVLRDEQGAATDGGAPVILPTATSAATPPPDSDSDFFPPELDLPSVALTVESFSAAGYPLGRLALQGRAVVRERLWQLERVTLTSPSASLTGQGQWRLRGAADGNAPRGLSLQAELTSENVGDYLREIGLGDVMQDGAGTLTAQLFWSDLPWRMRLPDLAGTIRLDVRRGRLSSIRSRSAKLLELLSAQSLQRLLNFDVRPGELFIGGFPFDRWSGTLHLDPHGIQTNDYLMQGAVGNIHLAGDMGWESGELDLQARVVPRLDLSGASLATGFLVNPLVGMGAMLSQWILRKPLSRAMTVRYTVKGNWQDPQIEEVSVSEEQSGAAPAPPADSSYAY